MTVRAKGSMLQFLVLGGFFFWGGLFFWCFFFLGVFFCEGGEGGSWGGVLGTLFYWVFCFLGGFCPFFHALGGGGRWGGNPPFLASGASLTSPNFVKKGEKANRKSNTFKGTNDFCRSDIQPM